MLSGKTVHGTLFFGVIMKKLLRTVFVRTLPVMAGYLALGVGFGILARANGIGILAVFAMSLFIYAGSMQFVAVGLVTGNATLATLALTTLMVNARHLFYGVSMIEPYKKLGKSKPYLIFGLTDETYALVCTGDVPDGIDRSRYCFFITLFNHIYWVTGSVLGAVAGSFITFSTEGIDFAMTALFITVFVEQWKSTRNHIPALIGVGSSLLCLLLFGADSFLIPAMGCICVLLLAGKRFIEKREGKAHG